ncbi:MAG: porin [Pseudomonadota bacterium]
MRRRVIAAAVLAFSALGSMPAQAKDDLLDTLAQKGILTPEEYDKLKAQQKTEVIVDTSEGFKIVSIDNANSLQIGTLLQLDSTQYNDDKTDLANGSELRRSRISTSGVLLKDWQYRFEYEFSGTAGVTDAYVAYTAFKPVIVTVGQFKQPIGMEALASDKNLTFMERGLPFAFIPPRAPGLMVGTSGYNWSLNGGIFGEPVGNASTGDEGFGLASRATFAPLLSQDKTVHLGLGAAWRKPTDNVGASTVAFSSKPESNVTALRFVNTATINNVHQYGIEVLELAGQVGAVSLQGEYSLTQVKRDTAPTLKFSGWYTQLAYTLTGEKRPYKADKGVFDGIRPTKNFGRDGWGAFEVAARISGIDLSDKTVNGGKERNAAVTFNWYLNPFMRMSANVVKVLKLEGGPLNDDEPTVFQIRAQLAL